MFQCAIMTSPIGTMDTHETIQIANTYATNNGIYYYSKILGKGSFGVVLEAQDQIQVRMVAIKIILAEKSLIQFLLGRTPAAAKAGQKEANMLTNLKHVNVIAIRDHFKFEVTRKWAAICDKQGTSIEEYMQTVIGSYWYMAPEVCGEHYT